MSMTWTKVGEKETRNAEGDDLRPAIEAAIRRLPWQAVPCTLGMMPGMAIQEAVKAFRIPKVSHVAVSHELAPLGLYGVRGHYSNGVGQS